MSNDTNTNPLPPHISREDVLTVADFLMDVGHPAYDMSRATVRYGRAIFDAFRRKHGRDPYTIRVAGAGPVKVYEKTDRPLMLDTYTEWSARDRAKQTSQLKHNETELT